MFKLLKANAEHHDSLKYVLETLSGQLIVYMKEQVEKLKFSSETLPETKQLSLFWKSYHEF